MGIQFSSFPLARANMRSFVALCLVAAEPIGIRSQSFDGPNPEFRYSFETENDISQSAEGTMKNVDGVDVVTMKGSYSYVGVDGNTWTVDWYADETGFHP